jgi:hypothetical protein
MSGTALHEACGALGHPEFDEMSEQQVRELVRGFFGPISNQVYDV